jgi:acetyl-CoA acyltransferase
MMGMVFAVDACRTPVGKIKGALAGVRPDHLTAEVIKALLARSSWLDPASIDDVYWGAANQAGEDNRNVARMGVLLLMSERALTAAGAAPLARYRGTAAAGVHPDYMGIGPVPALAKVLARTGWQSGDLDLVEVNEAFAAQAVAVVDELKLDPDLVNVNGGAIAIGHPLGCSGARITTTLLHELKRRGATKATATMCIGVGQGIATLWQAG